MPKGSVNQLAGRQQFLDLVRYLIEIAKHGPETARKLQPDADDLKVLAETSIDHAALLRKLPDLDLKAGRKLYQRYCLNCHGKDGNKTINPLARRFAKDKLKFGADPYSMWKTVTYGNGLMFPQAALMSPEERYLVVHYIREQFLRKANPGQYNTVSEEYLAKVNARAKVDAEKLGSEPTVAALAPGMIDGKQGRQMDYGPCLSHSIAFSKPPNKNAPRFVDTTERATVIQLPGGLVACYDMQRYSISGIWRGDIATTAKSHHTSYKGNTCLQPGGEVIYKNVDDPGWKIGRLETPPDKTDVKLRGHYLHGSQVLLRFLVGGRRVDELPGALPGKSPTLLRTLRVEPGKETLHVLVGRFPEGKTEITKGTAKLRGKGGNRLHAVLRGGIDRLVFESDGRGGLWLKIPPETETRTFTLCLAVGHSFETSPLPEQTAGPDLDALMHGGPQRWRRTVLTGGVLGKPVEGYAADEITVPYANPWGSWMRTTALDFFSDGRAAVSTLSGDVWIVRWTKPDLGDVTWSRFAAGLYEPLGLRIVDDKVYVRGRDRITRLHDLNGDGEADFYENFHQDGEIGPNYHAFIFDLQTDDTGNFYFAKSGRKSPHVGCVVRLSADGKSSEVICRDFRHPNGLGAGGPHNWVTVSDNPSGKAIYNGVALARRGGRHGYSGPRTTPMLAVLPATVDSSSGGQCWSDPRRWGPLGGCMIHTSYSRCAAFYIMTPNLQPHPNGFAVRFPFTFRSGVMRARVNPVDRQVYLVGQKGWDTQARFDGCLYRIRYAGGPTHLLANVAAVSRGLRLTFSCDLDKASITAKNFRTVREGKKTTGPVDLGGVRLVDQRTVEVHLPDIADEVVSRRSRVDKKRRVTFIDVRPPIRLTFNLKAKDGTAIRQTVYATVNSLPSR